MFSEIVSQLVLNFNKESLMKEIDDLIIIKPEKKQSEEKLEYCELCGWRCEFVQSHIIYCGGCEYIRGKYKTWIDEEGELCFEEIKKPQVKPEIKKPEVKQEVKAQVHNDILDSEDEDEDEEECFNLEFNVHYDNKDYAKKYGLFWNSDICKWCKQIYVNNIFELDEKQIHLKLKNLGNVFEFNFEYADLVKSKCSKTREIGYKVNDIFNKLQCEYKRKKNLVL